MKLGKHPAVIDRRTLRLREVAPALPKPLDTMDWFRGQTSFGVMGNDVLGDCTCAGLGHAEQTISGNSVGMDEITVPDSSVIDLYSKACGYAPSNESTDQGGNELDVLNYVKKNGLFGVDQLLGYADPDPGDVAHVKQAISFFGGVYIGLQLPDSVVRGNLLDNSWVLSGKIVPSPYNGHAVWVAGYNAIGPRCITWGVIKQMSWEFWQACCDEAHALLFKNWLGQYGGLADAAQAMTNALEGVAQ